MRCWIAALLASLAVHAPALAQQAAPAFDLAGAQNIAGGHALFNRRCAGRCHGIDGTEGEAAPAVRGKYYLSPPFVYATITTGRAGSAMPSWKDRLTEEELWQLVAFVVSLQNP